MTLMLTTRCNLSCAYCPQRRGAPREMALPVLDAAIRLVARSGHARPRLVLFGGEPLLAPRLVRRALRLLSAEARSGLAPEVRLVTNGLLLDGATAEVLDRHRVSVDLSCDGLGAAQERRGRGTGRRLRRLLERLASRHPALLRDRLVARLTLDAATAPALADAFAELLAHGVRDIQVSPRLTPDPSWGGHAVRALDDALMRISDAALRLPAVGGRAAFLPYRPPPPAPPAGRPACSAGASDVLFVDVDGGLAPCGAFARSVLPYLPRLAREVSEALAGPRVDDGRLDARLAARAGRARALPVLRSGPRRRSPGRRCASCTARSECFVCPASIAFARAQRPDLVPALQCDWNFLVARHRKDFLARAAAREAPPQRAARRSSAAATSAVTPVRIAGP